MMFLRSECKILIVIFSLIYMFIDIGFNFLYTPMIENSNFDTFRINLVEKLYEGEYSPWVAFTGEERGFFWYEWTE